MDKIKNLKDKYNILKKFLKNNNKIDTKKIK